MCEAGANGYGRVMNRFFRRMQRFGKSWSARGSQGEMVDTSEQLYQAGTPQDVTDPRTKNQEHGKKTADKWNQ